MRKSYLLGLVASGLMLVCAAGTAWAGDCHCGGMSNRSYQSLSGPPCFSPLNLAPGCCECPPSACDNAWAGYCQHKAKWQAYFAQVGTPRAGCYSSCRSGRCASSCGTPTPAVREVPASPAETTPTPAVSAGPEEPPLPPLPAAEKTSRIKVLYPWMR
jgi:hypothetical protein